MLVKEYIAEDKKKTSERIFIAEDFSWYCDDSCHKNEEEKPIHSFMTQIDWPYFHNDPMAQEKQQV